MKTGLIVLLAVAVIGGGWWYYAQQTPIVETPTPETPAATTDGTTVQNGVYTVDTSGSSVSWAVGKPLIEGYINSGTIGLKEGSITVAEQVAVGTFVLDMNTISVGATPTKPGKESSLEKHLKSDDFFDVVKYPTATFKITKVEAGADSDTTHTYTVTGDLTLKGKTLPVTFPAKIYEKDGLVHTHAEFVIDRTKWGVTYGSGSYFDNLADNAIEDNIHLTLAVVASKQP